MSLKDYLSHYLNIIEILKFLVVALIGTLICLLVIVFVAKVTTGGSTRQVRKVRFYYRAFNLAQRFDEMIFSATSILSFLAIYYLIDRFVTTGPVRRFWDSWSDFILLGMICFSCVINNYFDVMLIPLKKISREEKASVRLTGMFYIMIIFLYIKFIYENDNYDGFIMYFLGLMIGRFIYFDASFKDFVDAIKMAAKNIALLILGLSLTAAMCIYGFKNDYLLVSNGVLVSTFFAHLFVVVAIFIVHHTHVISIFVRKPKNLDIMNEASDEASEYDDYGEYDNYGEYEDDEEYMDSKYVNDREYVQDGWCEASEYARDVENEDLEYMEDDEY